jgi:hypothetical protein
MRPVAVARRTNFPEGPQQVQYWGLCDFEKARAATVTQAEPTPIAITKDGSAFSSKVGDRIEAFHFFKQEKAFHKYP